MRLPLCLSLLLGLSIGPPALGQSGKSPTVAPAPVSFGAVTGRVLCADTRGPARRAFVTFVPIPAEPPNGAFPPPLNLSHSDQAPAQTDMNGTFTQARLKPGRYYVNASLDGYLSPSSTFKLEELSRPTPAVRKRLKEELTEIVVEPDRTTEVELHLVRGASLSGTVLYDDGTPAIDVPVELMRKDAHGTFTEPTSPGGLQITDDNGRFHLTSLPPDEYLVCALLQITHQVEIETPMMGRQMSTSFVQIAFSLLVYPGDVFRRKDAVPLRLTDAEARSGVLITLPLSKLHRVSGTLLAPDGHTLSGGTVGLRYAGDDEDFASITVHREDGRFDLPYTPEGSFVLSIREARDLSDTSDTSGLSEIPGMPPDRVLRTYGNTQQPLLVKGDVDDLLITAPLQNQPTSAGAPSPTP